MAKTTMLRRAACVSLLLLGGFCAGTALQPETPARAWDREEPTRQAFLAGSERALPILQEMSETLKQIDGRLEKIEKAVAQAASR